MRSRCEEVKCALAAEVARARGFLRLRVTGASMLPAVWPDDVLNVQRRDPSEIHPGRIVLFERNGALTAHRVVRQFTDQGENWLVTRGDSLPREDAPVNASQLAGEVEWIERGGALIRPRVGLSPLGRVAAALACRSAVCTRILLKLYALRRHGVMHGAGA